jgi:hypothetical protein
VHEPLDTGFLRQLREAQAALVVDLVGDVAVELTHGIVRHLGEVHQRVVALQILDRDRRGCPW